ncbi:hypothetical protein GC176_26715 [bacterium]|nr:hypothetical protein [bacterium]
MSSALLLAAILSATAIDAAPALVDRVSVAAASTEERGVLSPEAVFYEPAEPAAIFVGNSRDDADAIRFTSLNTSLIRGQNYDEDPSGGNLSQPTFAAPPIGMPFAQQGTIWPGTPLLAPNGMFGGPPPAATTRGINGPQPFRFGWTSKFDVGFLPKEGVSGSGTSGKLSIFEFNSELRYTMPTPLQWIFSFAPQFNMRLWDGPTTPGLPADVYRFGSDIQLTSPTWGPYTFELAFTPSLNSSFETSLSSDAWNFDGRGAAFVRVNPQWLVMLGALYWDRVHDRVLPYAGVVYTPNDYVEIRATFPRADINFFIGTPWGVPQWFYVAGEYHVEAYQIEDSKLRRDQLEIQDWRAVLGIRSEYAGMTSFLEGGWVFGRKGEFLHAVGGTPETFNIASGFIVRAGLRW